MAELQESVRREACQKLVEMNVLWLSYEHVSGPSERAQLQPLVQRWKWLHAHNIQFFLGGEQNAFFFGEVLKVPSFDVRFPCHEVCIGSAQVYVGSSQNQATRLIRVAMYLEQRVMHKQNGEVVFFADGKPR